MRCERCNTELNEENTRYVHSSTLCEDCFDEGYTYCNRCDAVINRSQAYYDNCGDAYCEECYDENYDDDCPENPPVDDDDRQIIVMLSRNWLQGKVDTRKLIDINESDHSLKHIRKELGLVDKPLYCFGLINRTEYQLSASFDLMDEVRKYFTDRNLDYHLQFVTGTRRIGLSEDLRKQTPQLILELLKTLTSTQSQASTEAA